MKVNQIPLDTDLAHSLKATPPTGQKKRRLLLFHFQEFMVQLHNYSTAKTSKAQFKTNCIFEAKFHAISLKSLNSSTRSVLRTVLVWSV